MCRITPTCGSACTTWMTSLKSANQRSSLARWRIFICPVFMILTLYIGTSSTMQCMTIHKLSLHQFFSFLLWSQKASVFTRMWSPGCRSTTPAFLSQILLHLWASWNAKSHALLRACCSHLYKTVTYLSNVLVVHTAIIWWWEIAGWSVYVASGWTLSRGEKPVTNDLVALYTWMTNPRCIGHSHLLSSSSLPIILIRFWWILSTCPLLCGWYGDVQILLMHR